MKVPRELVETIHKFCNIDTRFTVEKVIGQNIRHRLNMEESEPLGLFKSEVIIYNSVNDIWIIKTNNIHYHISSPYVKSQFRYFVEELILNSNGSIVGIFSYFI